MSRYPVRFWLRTGARSFLQTAPGLFATWVYPLALLLLLLVNQPLALWLVLAAGVYAHGVRYPRQHGVFKRGYFFSFIAGVVIPFAAIFWAVQRP